MKSMIDTIREALTYWREAEPYLSVTTTAKALTALDELERLAGEPVAWTSLIEIDWAKRNPGRAGSFYAVKEGPSSLPLYAVAPPDQQPQKLKDSEQYRMQMAGISTAATGYWKEGDSIHPDYDTPALRDVAKLYAKYDELYKAQQPQYEAGDMASAHNDGFRAGVASVTQQAEAVPLDTGVMELAESVGLIGPASRTDDFHAAIQRFHDLISMNVSIKAAVHFAQGLPKKGGAA